MESEITTQGKLTLVEKNNQLQTLVFNEGQSFNCQWGINQSKTLKIMAIVDKYVMARYKGCMPFIKHENEFGKFLEYVNAKLLK